MQITGQVTGPDGASLAGVPISGVGTIGISAFNYEATYGATTTTGGDGRYTLPAAALSTTQPQSVTLTPGRAPGQPRLVPAASQTVSVVRGGSTTADFVFGLGSEIAGQVVRTDDSRRPVAEAEVLAGGGFSAPAATTQSGGDGRFSLIVPSTGTYQIVARKDQYVLVGPDAQAVVTALNQTVAADRDLPLLPSDGAEVSGQVLDPNGQTLSDSFITATTAGGAWRAFTRSA